MRCWSREREFGYESLLGKKVFLSFYSSFCDSLIPAVLGKVGENGMRSLYLFLSGFGLLGRNPDLSNHFQSFITAEVWLAQAEAALNCHIHITET